MDEFAGTSKAMLGLADEVRVVRSERDRRERVSGICITVPAKVASLC